MDSRFRTHSFPLGVARIDASCSSESPSSGYAHEYIARVSNFCFFSNLASSSSPPSPLSPPSMLNEDASPPEYARSPSDVAFAPAHVPHRNDLARELNRTLDLIVQSIGSASHASPFGIARSRSAATVRDAPAVPDAKFFRFARAAFDRAAPLAPNARVTASSTVFVVVADAPRAFDRAAGIARRAEMWRGLHGGRDCRDGAAATLLRFISL
jgi:hypothetical protein